MDYSKETADKVTDIGQILINETLRRCGMRLDRAIIIPMNPSIKEELYLERLGTNGYAITKPIE